MQRLVVFRTLAGRAFRTKVRKIVERNKGLDIKISKLPRHSPERSFFVEHCTNAWKRGSTAEATALLYEGMFVGNDYRYPRDAVEAGAGLKRFGEMLKDQDEKA